MYGTYSGKRSHVMFFHAFVSMMRHGNVLNNKMEWKCGVPLLCVYIANIFCWIQISKKQINFVQTSKKVFRCSKEARTHRFTQTQKHTDKAKHNTERHFTRNQNNGFFRALYLIFTFYLHLWVHFICKQWKNIGRNNIVEELNKQKYVCALFACTVFDYDKSVPFSAIFAYSQNKNTCEPTKKQKTWPLFQVANSQPANPVGLWCDINLKCKKTEKDFSCGFTISDRLTANQFYFRLYFVFSFRRGKNIVAAF